MSGYSLCAYCGALMQSNTAGIATCPCVTDRAARGAHAAYAGRKDDHGKPRFGLVPPRALEAVARVLSYGAAKYGAENWRRVPDLRSRYVDAALRHLNAHQRGEERDPESGLPHLAHAACSLLFVLEYAALSSAAPSGSLGAARPP